MGLFEIITDLLPLASAIGLLLLMIALLPSRKKAGEGESTAAAPGAALESSRPKCELLDS